MKKDHSHMMGGDNMATRTQRRQQQATKAKVEKAIAEAPVTEEKKPEVVRPEDLAKELGVNGKQIRAFLRATFPRPTEQKRSSWYLTEQQVKAVRDRFTPSEDEESEGEA